MEEYDKMKTINPRRERKIQQVGYTFLLTIPKDWIYHHNLKRHSKVSFAYGDNAELILTPKDEIGYSGKGIEYKEDD